MATLSDYLRLMRISLLPTAWSNVLTGFALASTVPAWGESITFLIAALICSSCLYIGGMVLNDVFDFELDSIERPERVLPAGKIPRSAAKRLGLALLIAPMLISFYLSFAFGDRMLGTPTFFVTVALAASIVCYNVKAKHTPVGPLVMGFCRTLNILLGCSLAGLAAFQWYIAGAAGIYVAGITWLARNENTTSQRHSLIAGSAVMLLGVILLGCFPYTSLYSDQFRSVLAIESEKRHTLLFVCLLAVMVFPVVRKILAAVTTGRPGDVKRAVITSLLTIIMLDATICYLVLPGIPAYALGVACLIVPAFLLSRRIMAT